MRISIRTIYGIQALFEIALHPGSEGVSSAAIAEAQGISPNFLEQILSSLKKHKLVKSFRGRSGGYQLSRPAGEITLLDAIEALEGPIALAGGVKRKGAILDAFKMIENKFTAELKNTTFADMVADKQKKEKIALYSI
jgi:Rrf2 family protein